MFTREFGLVPNRDDSAPRTMRIVKWETRVIPVVLDGEPYEEYTLVPIVWEWSYLQQEVRLQSAADYASGRPVYKYKWVPTAIYEIPISRVFSPPHVSEAHEPENLRRRRILAARQVTHANPANWIPVQWYDDSGLVCNAAP